MWWWTIKTLSISLSLSYSPTAKSAGQNFSVSSTSPSVFTLAIWAPNPTQWDVYPKEAGSDYASINLINLQPMFMQEQLASSLCAVVIKYNKLPLIKKSIKTKELKNRDQKRPTHDAYTHPDDHLRALVPATNQKKRAYRWRPTGTRTEATQRTRVA